MEERNRIITGRGHSSKGRAHPLLPLAPETTITSQTIISDQDLVLHDRVGIGMLLDSPSFSTQIFYVFTLID